MRESILAIELSQRAGSIALRPRVDADVVEMAVPPSDDANDHLMAAIDELCRAHHVGPHELAAIAVSCGPGGFTGLRVACATAKAIADVTGCAVIAVPSALSAARAAFRAGEVPDTGCTVALACKEQDAWCTEVAFDGGAPSIVSARLMGAGDEAGLRWPVVADKHLTPALARAAAAHGGAIAARWSAAACLEAGESLLARGERTDPLALGPIYPRPAEAVTLWEARHGGDSPATGGR